MCQLRGHFLGHWLSGAYRIAVIARNAQLKAKADDVVAELAVCQERNGGRWCGSIPEKYFDLLAAEKAPWAPHYVSIKP